MKVQDVWFISTKEEIESMKTLNKIEFLILSLEGKKVPSDLHKALLNLANELVKVVYMTPNEDFKDNGKEFKLK